MNTRKSGLSVACLAQKMPITRVPLSLFFTNKLLYNFLENDAILIHHKYSVCPVPTEK